MKTTAEIILVLLFAFLLFVASGCQDPEFPDDDNTELTLEDVLVSLSDETYFEYIESIADGDNIRKAELEFDGATFTVRTYNLVYGVSQEWEIDIIYSGNLLTGNYDNDTSSFTYSLNGSFSTVTVTDTGFTLDIDGETISFLDISPYPESDMFYDGPLLDDLISELNGSDYFEFDYSYGEIVYRYTFVFDGDDTISITKDRVYIGISPEWELVETFTMLKSATSNTYTNQTFTTSFSGTPGTIALSEDGIIIDGSHECLADIPAETGDIFGPSVAEILLNFTGKTYYYHYGYDNTARKYVFLSSDEDTATFDYYTATINLSSEWTYGGTSNWYFEGVTRYPKSSDNIPSIYKPLNGIETKYVYFIDGGLANSILSWDSEYHYYTSVDYYVYYDDVQRSWGGILLRDPEDFLPGTMIYFPDPSYEGAFTALDFDLSEIPNLYTYVDYAYQTGGSWYEMTATTDTKALHTGDVPDADNKFFFQFLYSSSGVNKTSYRTIEDIGGGWFEMIYYTDNTYSTIMTNYSGDDMNYLGNTDPARVGTIPVP